MIQGACLCGAIKLQIGGDIEDASYCHCSICQKLTGSAFGAYGSVEKAKFKWVQGQENLREYHPNPSTKRLFCSTCGSFLATEHKLEPGSIFVSLGSLANELELEILYHQFVGSRAPWHTIGDHLPQHQDWPDEY